MWMILVIICSMKYWLMKSEPNTYSIDDLKKAQRDCWDGIRNYQVRNMIVRDMQIGDQAFFYHSSCAVPGIVGIMQIVSDAYPDPTAFDTHSKYFDSKSTLENPRWWMRDVKFIEKFQKIITLTALRANVALQDLRLLQKGNRLSILPLSKSEWDLILAMQN